METLNTYEPVLLYALRISRLLQGKIVCVTLISVIESSLSIQLPYRVCHSTPNVCVHILLHNHNIQCEIFGTQYLNSNHLSFVKIHPIFRAELHLYLLIYAECFYIWIFILLKYYFV